MEIKMLKPCPLCGNKVDITELCMNIATTGRHQGEMNYAKIECSCGLTFEKEWFAADPKDGFVIKNDNIYTAWNCRAN